MGNKVEVWKDILGYEDYYQVSNLGRVKRLSRCIVKSDNNSSLLKEKILKQRKCYKGYFRINLHKNGLQETINIHQLVAESFLNHKRIGFKLTVDHIDFNKKNNCADNLKILTHRENSRKKPIKCSGKYVGVSWYKPLNKWRARIGINGKYKHLGYFINDLDAKRAYELELSASGFSFLKLLAWKN